jgi:hypothetical protein
MKLNKPTTFTLRILGTKPSLIPMDRLGEYLSKFADLLGKDNKPVFKAVKNKSVGIVAAVRTSDVVDVRARITQAKNNPDSRPGRALAGINSMLVADRHLKAELIDPDSNVVYLFLNHPRPDPEVYRVQMSGEVDGVVLGISGRDETMHLHIVDHHERDIRLLVRNEALARQILKYFRADPIRLSVEGHWVRGEEGWIPESNRCTAIAFEVLSSDLPSEIFSRFSGEQNHDWLSLEKPLGFLADIRGCN